MALQDAILNGFLGGIKDLINQLIMKINSILSGLVPAYESYLIFFGAGLWAYWLKSKNHWSMIGFVIATFTIYFAFKYIGLGG